MSKPTADEWEQAVTNIFEHYPADMFPPDSDSPDAKAGTWARKICLNIISEAWRLNTEHYAEQDHRLHHVRPHPNGGTWPYAKPVCECDQFDGDPRG